MALTDYAGLQASIVSWAMRDGDADFTARVPDFITLAEARLSSDLRVSAMEAYAAGSPDAGGYINLPDDFLELRTVTTQTPGYPALGFVDPAQNAADYPRSGVPSTYSIVGRQLRTYPAANGPITISYYAKIPALSGSNPTNWLLTRYPNCYLYASLLESAPFMEDDAQMQRWAAAYQAAIQGVKSDDVGARFAGGAMRVRSETP